MSEDDFPRVQDGQLIPIGVRVSRAEKRALEERARAAKQELSPFIREILNDLLKRPA